VHSDFRNAIVLHNGQIHRRQFLSVINRAATFANGTPVALLTTGQCEKHAIHFQHKDRVALNRVLHIHQPNYLQRQSQPLRIFADGIENRG